MKILDRYILVSFLQTFATVFVILFFIFILQGIWLFIADLAGKDLDSFLIIKFLLFYAPKVVPLVLPLSVLLASIMTFGNFAENYEFAAMKSSGISLGRAMQSLTIFIALLSIVAFLFANNIIPQAEYKFVNLKKTIAQQKPSLAIAEGQFSPLGSYYIKVNKKYGEDKNKLQDITIHKISNLGVGVSVVIKAKRGEIVSNENSNFLQLVLYDGNYYEDIIPKKYEERNRVPFAKSSFEKYIINYDLAPLQKNNMDDVQITNTNTMLNINELRYTLDSLELNQKKELVQHAENMYQRQTILTTIKTKSVVKKDSLILPPNYSKKTKKDTLVNDLLSLLQPYQKTQVLAVAKSNLSNTKYSIEGAVYDIESKTKNINNHWLAFYEKFVIAYACILMFFIGAPLGAIIRKGGLGLPIVFAMVIFIVFHFINVFGKKLAQEDGITPFLGAWLSSFILSPLAILLTYRATNDIGLMINFDWITNPIIKFFSRKNAKDIEFKKEIVSLDTVWLDLNNKSVIELNNQDTNVLINIVKNADQFNLDSQNRLIVLKILENRGITQQELLESNLLFNKDYLKLKYLVEQYNYLSKISLFFYSISFVLNAFLFTNNIFIIIFGIISIILMYIFIYKSIQNLDEIKVLTNRNNFTNIYVSIILGFPFLIFIYLYNKSHLKDTLKEFNS